MSRFRLIDRQHRETYYHLIARVTDAHWHGHDFPLTPSMKDELVRKLMKFDQFYTIDILAYCVMSTHFHIVIRVSKDAEKKISLREIARRYEKLHDGRRSFDARSHECHSARRRLNDISDFMNQLLSQTARSFNRANGWQSTFWRQRFTSVLLRSPRAVSACLKYVELNPVRARIVCDPGNYRWSSWGISEGGMKHPFRFRIVKCLRGLLPELCNRSDKAVFAIYGQKLKILALKSCRCKEQYIDAVGLQFYQSLLKNNSELNHARIVDCEFEGVDDS